ncbi:hypothetical protein BJ165DRAFT_1407897 [Panaeolus papilionaceus]|nr:hypothetical protein BJ165DRAFT_1407897 [Panaeolus papilionaceus]
MYGSLWFYIEKASAIVLDNVAIISTGWGDRESISLVVMVVEVQGYAKGSKLAALIRRCTVQRDPDFSTLRQVIMRFKLSIRSLPRHIERGSEVTRYFNRTGWDKDLKDNNVRQGGIERASEEEGGDMYRKSDVNGIMGLRVITGMQSRYKVVKAERRWKR